MSVSKLNGLEGNQNYITEIFSNISTEKNLLISIKSLFITKTYSIINIHVLQMTIKDGI